MQFLIADTFTSSLGKLTDTEQKQVKTSAFDMQMNPANPGFQFSLNAARDPYFWQVRVNRDIRIVVHRSESRLLLCYVDHHDDSINGVREEARNSSKDRSSCSACRSARPSKEIVVPTYVETLRTHLAQKALASVTLSNYFNTVFQKIGLLTSLKPMKIKYLNWWIICQQIEAVLERATGGLPPIPEKPQSDHDPFDHPDSFRRFRVVAKN